MKKTLEKNTGLTLDYVGTLKDFTQEEIYKDLLILLKKEGVWSTNHEKWIQLAVVHYIEEKDGKNYSHKVDGNSMFTFFSKEKQITKEEKDDFISVIKEKIDNSGYKNGDKEIRITMGR